MADDGWSGRSHADIVAKLSALKSENAYDLGNTWSEIYTDLSDAADKHDLARRQLATEGFWTGKGPAAALRTLTARTTEFDDSETGTPALAGRMGNALAQDGEVLRAAKHVAEEHPELGSGAPTQRKKEELEALRNEAQRLYTTPLEAKRPEITDNAGQSMGGAMPQGPGGNSTGGGNGSGAGGGSQTPQSSSGAEGLASKDTKPQLAGGDGQQAGAGQGQGGGQGAGSGGGAPGGGQGSGGTGSGAGGLGSGGKDSASGMPVGGTTAAGFSPSTTGTGPGGAPGSGAAGGGLSGLRGGGLPGGAAAGSGPGGANPAGVGAAGVRSIGGPMGMMGGVGAHGRGGKGEDDDEHATPEWLKNLDNSGEWLGERRTFIPGGVLGDFKAAEDADKQALEAEKRRFKSIGWNVKFSDEEEQGGKR